MKVYSPGAVALSAPKRHFLPCQRVIKAQNKKRQSFTGARHLRNCKVAPGHQAEGSCVNGSTPLGCQVS